MQNLKCSVKPEIFRAVRDVDISSLSDSKEFDLRPVLPCLVRMALCKPLDESSNWTKAKKEVLKILSGIEVVNGIVALLSIDFHALEQDVKKEQQLRTKIGTSQTDSVLISQLQCGLAMEFERSDHARRIRLLLSELLFVASQMKENKAEFYFKSSELLESIVYLEEVSDVLCIAQAELPTLLQIKDVAETLLHLPNGGWLLCRLVANSPDSFKEVCTSLVANGETQDEESMSGRRRMEVLLNLCTMNPGEMLNIRALCVEHCTMPGLAVALTLLTSKDYHGVAMDIKDKTADVIAFVCGLLLSNNLNVRSWFSQYVKLGQKKRQDPQASTLQALRHHLLEHLVSILPAGREPISDILQASSFIRLYCVLKGMGGLKFSDEEMRLLLRLVTSHPLQNKAGSRFVSLGLSMIMLCPYLLTNGEQEKHVIEWIRWLMDRQEEFEQTVGDSYGEMLFLIAIHFHSNNTTAIGELVSSTLGMKAPVKGNALSRLRQIFTQEIFKEQVVTTHAVKVPVTPNLNGHMTGYLPINSVYQLLKTRSFSKYKVPIKDWIYRQICSSGCPLHNLLPSLIEVYVNSIIIKSTKTDHLNEPLSNQEVLDVYKSSVFGQSRGDNSFNQEDNSLSSQKGANSVYNLTPQLIVLYYLLLYEDTVLNHMKIIVSGDRKVKTYPDGVLSKIPINFLLQQAQKNQHQYPGLFPSLLKLLVTHYPHLCTIEDWLEESLTIQSISQEISPLTKTTITLEQFQQAIDGLPLRTSEMIVALQTLLRMPADTILQFSDKFLGCLILILDTRIPRKVVDLVRKVWIKLHSISPRSIRLATVNALRQSNKRGAVITQYTENDVTIDPLIILRCDNRVYRCPPILEIILCILSAYMQASKVYLHNHTLVNPILDHASQTDQERRDLKNALIMAQDSAVVQILLECCLPKEDEEEEGLLHNRREIQCVICSFIHKIFISDPHLAKLIHFQGYPEELLNITVPGIPSMHICLDFVPELLSQPQMHKQIFAIKMMAHLCCQYALPKSLNIAKLAVNVMFTMVNVLGAGDKLEFFLETVPYLVKVCQAFPPLFEDVNSLLLQLGRVCVSQLSCNSNIIATEQTDLNFEPSKKKSKYSLLSPELTVQFEELHGLVRQTFSNIVKKSIVTRNIYS
ncbi:integrator complex subunit 2-like [Mytilus galloprovincialis]|uniref:integrator complex subunit 2-like n=1 Tax=Mytilus galloprovincialis TaxID=29158 RepID=UPI003F7B8FC6